ncbi:polyamine ABC transporter substrate-binding protein [Leekyejoonella antrihumi]|uniref:Spermidine/putrescine ABC transporter substrate-binding protein n=1 Tax=Leekyejoonella antrihumi TaxID=1660198 RepID=A0A563E2V0_9MICO|nr:spermidine/putrescine ABC transporter substrate-binding protein [Leekyejoonella antrihumi]TWP36629.1 spermidine/putrescine ABC transporter substrate-binding protein [Leekyejoonella antrihumi]
MTDSSDQIRALVPTTLARHISRRGFLTGLAAAGAIPALAACGGSSGSSGSSGQPSASSGPASSGPAQLGSSLSVYTWGAYDNPKTFTNFTGALGPKVSISSYDSNPEMIAKLVSAKGTSGYDIVVPTGPYVPQMAANHLLMELDHAKLPNLKNYDPAYLDKPWDRGNKYSVPKDWGSTGFVYDTTKITRPMKTWNDFLAAAQNEASGQTSVLDDPDEFVGLYFFAHDMSWTTTNQSDLKKCQAFLVDKLAPHIKKFDAYPGSGGGMPKGEYTLMQAWNGDARQGFLAVKNASQYKWVLPGPASHLWIDNWSIAAGAPHPDAAHAFINYVLDPGHSLLEIEFIGYNTAIVGTEAKAKAAGLKYLDMIYFTKAQVAELQSGAVNSATQTHVSILNAAKAAAAG